MSEAKPFSARNLREKIWEGGLAGMLDYADDIDEYDVSDELKALYKSAVEAYDTLVNAFDAEVGE